MNAYVALLLFGLVCLLLLPGWILVKCHQWFHPMIGPSDEPISLISFFRFYPVIWILCIKRKVAKDIEQLMIGLSEVLERVREHHAFSGFQPVQDVFQQGIWYFSLPGFDGERVHVFAIDNRISSVGVRPEPVCL